MILDQNKFMSKKIGFVIETFFSEKQVSVTKKISVRNKFHSQNWVSFIEIRFCNEKKVVSLKQYSVTKIGFRHKKNIAYTKKKFCNSKKKLFSTLKKNSAKKTKKFLLQKTESLGHVTSRKHLKGAKQKTVCLLQKIQV